MKNKGFTVVEVCVVVAMLGIIIVAFSLPAFSCRQKAAMMNMRHDWGPIQGCMIEPTPGQWVSLNNYRVL